MVDHCVFFMPFLQGISYADILYIWLGACLNPVTVGKYSNMNGWILYAFCEGNPFFTFTIHCEPAFWHVWARPKNSWPFWVVDDFFEQPTLNRFEVDLDDFGLCFFCMKCINAKSRILFLMRSMGRILYIYLHDWLIVVVFMVGKYRSNGFNIDPMGLCLQPKWPLFWLEFGPCFGGVDLQNRGHWGSRCI